MGHFRVLVALSIVSGRGPICHSRPSASESENNNGEGKEEEGWREKKKTDG